MSESVQGSEEEIKKAKWTEKLKNQKGIMIGAVAVAAVAILIGLGIYNTPTNRLNRQLDLGQKYLEEQNYEQAIIAFNQAIEIDDRCLEAYVGGIEAYVQSGNVEELSAFYEKALEAARSLEGEVLDANINYVSFIYIVVDDVYDELDKIIDTLGEGLVVTGDNAEIKEKLANYLIEYIEVLIAAKNYAEAKNLIEEYKGFELGIDFAALLTRVEELEKIEAENMAFMSNVYSLMSAEDYEGMMGVDGSEEARTFVERMESNYYVYIPEDDTGLNGVGVGVYKYEENVVGLSTYYFYYGNYQNGKRIGKGTSFKEKAEIGYTIFDGEWKNDAPNGYGKEKRVWNKDAPNGYDKEKLTDSVMTGNLVDGLWDGAICETTNFMGNTFDLSFIAVAGTPIENKTEEFFKDCVEVSFDFEKKYVYAYDKNLCGSWYYGYTLGTIGYGGPIEE